MKPIYLAGLALAISIMSCAQNIPASKVPSVVLNTAKAKIASGAQIEWEKKSNYYEAEYDVDSIEHCLHIDPAGNLILHKWDVAITSIPQSVVQAVQSGQPGYRIDDAKMVDKNGQLSYELELEGKGKKDIKVYYDANGKLISKL